MSLLYEVPEDKQLRVIVDTDAACEADDPFAIAHALMSKKLNVKAIFAEQFGSPETTKKSYDVILEVLDAMNMDVPVYMGEEGNLNAVKGKPISPASEYLIKEAMLEDPKPLYVLCMGAITNIATALQAAPEIASRMTVVWIGGQNPDDFSKDHREFNSGNDIDAVNLVIDSGVEFWQIPNNAYGSMHIGLAEIQNRIMPCGKIGKYLFDTMISYNMSKYAGWTAGESWSLGDSPAVGVVLEPNCGHSEYREAPIFNQDTSYTFKEGRRKIKIYKSINSRFILEDFISKLNLIYGEK